MCLRDEMDEEEISSNWLLAMGWKWKGDEQIAGMHLKKDFNGWMTPIVTLFCDKAQSVLWASVSRSDCVIKSLRESRQLSSLAALIKELEARARWKELLLTKVVLTRSLLHYVAEQTSKINRKAKRFFYGFRMTASEWRESLASKRWAYLCMNSNDDDSAGNAFLMWKTARFVLF